MNIIAMDLSKFNSMFCFYDSVTQECSTTKAPTERKYFGLVLKADDQILSWWTNGLN